MIELFEEIEEARNTLVEIQTLIQQTGKSAKDASNRSISLSTSVKTSSKGIALAVTVATGLAFPMGTDKPKVEEMKDG